MVTPERIIAAAIEHNVDIIGFKWNVRTSLDEMVYWPKVRQTDIKIPIMIGGATTSPCLTLLMKIAPQYGQTVNSAHVVSTEPRNDRR
jgi:5-methyltetrahydrofolate--homocysteine methyltransferase